MLIHYDEITRIIKKYGIANKDGFRNDIVSLLGIPLPPPKPVTIAAQPHVAITPHDFIPKNSYDAAMKLIREHNNKGWFHITEVPENLFRDFMMIADIRPEIEFDEEAECQYVRVTNFGRK